MTHGNVGQLDPAVGPRAVCFFCALRLVGCWKMFFREVRVVLTDNSDGQGTESEHVQ